MAAEQHMSWCVGKHDGWDCVIKHVLPFGHKSFGHGATIEMNGAPCDHLSIVVDTGATLTDVDDLDAYVEHLSAVIGYLLSLRKTFEASRDEADCDDSHNHD